MINEEKRFYVDKRIGCIAIIDSYLYLYNHFFNYFDNNTKGVINYIHGIYDIEKGWIISEKDIDYLNNKCDLLNEANLYLEKIIYEYVI